MQDDDEVLLRVAQGERMDYCRVVSISPGEAEMALHADAEQELLIVQNGAGGLTYRSEVRALGKGDRVSITADTDYTISSKSGILVLVFGMSSVAQ